MLKRSMDILDIHYVANWYEGGLEGCIVDNIYYAGYYWLLKLRCIRGKYYLKLEPGVRLHISKVEPLSKGIDRFAAFMRKYIRGARIRGVSQIGWERIAAISLYTSRKDYRLIIEVIPRGFLVLVDSSNRIMYANRFAELRDRAIKRGVEYESPPGNLDKEQYFSTLPERLYVGRDLVRGIAKGWGLPGYIAEEILYRAGLYSERDKKPSEIAKNDVDSLIETYHSVIGEALQGKGFLVLAGSPEAPLLYTAFKPTIYTELYDTMVKEYESLDELIDYYFAEYEKKRMAEKRRKKVEGEVKALEKTIETQKKLLKEFEKKSRELEKLNEILARNYVVVERALECAKRVRKEKGWDSIPGICREVERAEKSKGLIYVALEGFEIPLDIRLSVWDNIANYGKLAGEYKRKAEKARIHLDSLEKRLESLSSTAISLEEEVVKGIKPKYWFERYHWLITTNGFLAIAGRDAGQNESLVRKYLTDKDLFLHAEVHGAPVAILRTEGREPQDVDIEDAAALTACYSRGWKEGVGYLNVFWVYGNQVSKAPPAGEYLPRGSFMVYGKKNYVRVELKLGIGIEELCDPVYGVYQRVIVGPVGLVESRSLVYAVLVPGEKSVSSTARSLYEKYRDLLGRGLGVSLDEIANRIPSGSRILVVRKGKAGFIEEC